MSSQFDIMKETEGCFHCGLPIPTEVNERIQIEGVVRQMCCRGCLAVAEEIIRAGLIDYYHKRDALPPSPGQYANAPAELKSLGIFDLPEVKKDWVSQPKAGEEEVSLVLEDMRCAACVWLIDKHLHQLDGVSHVSVNYATHRVRVRWHQSQIQLSSILALINRLGYRAHPFNPEKSQRLQQAQRKKALWQIFIAGLSAMQVMMYSVPAYFSSPQTMSFEVQQLMRWVSLLMTLPVMFFSAMPFFQGAVRGLRLGKLGMDVPVALGVTVAFLFSLYSVWRGHGEIYFESVAMFVFFLLSGRYLEMMARHRANREVEALDKALPVVAERFDPGSSDFEWAAAAQLAVGDQVRVLPGALIPADGSILEGDSAVDESLLTGESMPIPKTQGDRVMAGAVNSDGVLLILVEKVGKSTHLATLSRLMDRAIASRPRLLEMTEKIVIWFVAVLLFLATVTLLVWLQISPADAVPVFVSILVVSCPCAFSLATPIAMTISMGVAAQKGLLVTRSEALEALTKIDTIAFDKTGTLTQGKPRVTQVWFNEQVAEVSDLVPRWVYELESHSAHPVARSLCDFYRQTKSCRASLSQVKTMSGQGVKAVSSDGAVVKIGRPAYVCSEAAYPQEVANWQAGTLVALGAVKQNQFQWVAFFRLEDTLRDHVLSVLGALRSQGLALAMLSGDNQKVVDSLAPSLGVLEARGGLLPEDKQAWIQKRQQQGHVVAMVGDGVNDSLVLAQSHVSFAMGGGAELSRTQADLVVLNDRLASVPEAIHLARQTVRIIRQNISWAIGYNLAMLPLAMMGWIQPWLAALGMSISSLAVVFNSLRLIRLSKQT